MSNVTNFVHAERQAGYMDRFSRCQANMVDFYRSELLRCQKISYVSTEGLFRPTNSAVVSEKEMILWEFACDPVIGQDILAGRVFQNGFLHDDDKAYIEKLSNELAIVPVPLAVSHLLTEPEERSEGDIDLTWDSESFVFFGRANGEGNRAKLYLSEVLTDQLTIGNENLSSLPSKNQLKSFLKDVCFSNRQMVNTLDTVHFNTLTLKKYVLSNCHTYHRVSNSIMSSLLYTQFIRNV